MGVTSRHTIEDHRGTTIFCCSGNLHEFIGIAMCCIKTKTSSSLGNLYEVVYGHFPKAHRCFSYEKVGSACATKPTLRDQVRVKCMLLPVRPYYTRPPQQLLHVNWCALMLCTVLQDGVYDLDGSLAGCVQWSPRQAQGGYASYVE